MQQTPELLNTTVYSTQFSLIPSFIRSVLPGKDKAPNILSLHTTIKLPKTEIQSEKSRILEYYRRFMHKTVLTSCIQ